MLLIIQSLKLECYFIPISYFRNQEAVVGAGLRFYDLDNPFLYPSGEQTKLVFSPLLIDGWRQATQEISYVFHFDSCTSSLRDFYKREYN